MHSKIVLMLGLAAAALSSGMEETALDRLRLTTDRLIAVGEDMVGEPISGTMGPGDTVEVAVALDSTYSYHIYIWTNSMFNLVDFWVRDPCGEVAEMADGDHSTLSIYPDTVGEFRLMMTLHQAEEADSAGYAAALFHRPRMSMATPEGG
ncbi:MAG: hypothetical protein R6U36_09360 [Candidatus Fermentibacteraceae bacterium]